MLKPQTVSSKEETLLCLPFESMFWLQGVEWPMVASGRSTSGKMVVAHKVGPFSRDAEKERWI
jgi:hypothetical protein